jgi:hypothetical protein
VLEDRSGMRSSSGGHCFDIMELGRSFVDFRVEWVCREANSVAHCCASMVTATELLVLARLYPGLVVGISSR